MENFTTNIAFGAAGSIVGAIILSILGLLCTKVFIPSIRGMLIRTPDISGEWKYTEKGSDGREIRGRMKVRQLGTRIKATVEREHNNKRVFNYNGTFEAGQLVLNFEEPGNEGFIIGAMVLKLSSSTKVLEGKTVYFHHKTNRVIANDKYFRRCQ